MIWCQQNLVIYLAGRPVQLLDDRETDPGRAPRRRSTPPTPPTPSCAGRRARETSPRPGGGTETDRADF